MREIMVSTCEYCGNEYIEVWDACPTCGARQFKREMKRVKDQRVQVIGPTIGSTGAMYADDVFILGPVVNTIFRFADELHEAWEQGGRKMPERR